MTDMEMDDLRSRLVVADANINSLKSELKTAVNELCLRCGSYKVEHLGGECTDCRFRKIRHGDFSDII